MSPFQKRSAKAFQVCEQGLLNRCHRVHAQRGAPQRQNKKKKGGRYGGTFALLPLLWRDAPLKNPSSCATHYQFVCRLDSPALFVGMPVKVTRFRRKRCVCCLMCFARGSVET